MKELEKMMDGEQKEIKESFQMREKKEDEGWKGDRNENTSRL